MDFLEEITGVNPIEIWMARARIRPFIDRTPLIYSPALSQRTGSSIYLKMECWQRCGCFKVRGAVNMVSALPVEVRNKGLVTASSGNHALAVGYASSLFGCPETTVFLPTYADPAKVKKIKQYNVNIIYHGETFLESYDAATEFCRAKGQVYIHSHADPMIIAGQGTIGFEIIEDLPEVDALIAPIGGGGLISGIAEAVKSNNPDVELIGVEPLAAPAAFMSLRDHKCYDRIDTLPSIADGLLGGIGHLPYQIIQKNIERVFLVDEDEIGKALGVMQEDEQLMIEPSSAVVLGALLKGIDGLMDKKVVLVITSRNISAHKFNQLVMR